MKIDKTKNQLKEIANSFIGSFSNNDFSARLYSTESSFPAAVFEDLKSDFKFTIDVHIIVNKVIISLLLKHGNRETYWKEVNTKIENFDEEFALLATEDFDKWVKLTFDNLFMLLKEDKLTKEEIKKNFVNSFEKIPEGSDRAVYKKNNFPYELCDLNSENEMKEEVKKLLEKFLSQLTGKDIKAK